MKYYAVKSIDGKTVNKLYTDWEGANGCAVAVTHHKSVFKSFKTEVEARNFLHSKPIADYAKPRKYSGFADDETPINTDDTESDLVMNEEMEIRGQFINPVFENEDTGYCVFSYKVSDRGRIRCVGYNLPKEKNSICIMRGEYVTNKYGLNFEVKSYEIERKTTKAGVIEFLCLLDGVGKALAGRIWDEFGKDTYKILENDVERLVCVQGISLDKAKKIKSAYGKVQSISELSKFLIEYNIAPKFAKKIVNKYGTDALDKIKKNPYLLFEISGITFESSDSLAMKMNMPKDSAKRFNACIRSILLEGELNGDTGVEVSELQKKAFSILKMDNAEESQKEWMRMFKDKELHAVRLDMNGTGLKQYIFSDSVYQMEKKCAKMISELATFKPESKNWDKLIVKSEVNDTLLLDATQIDAVINGLSYGMTVIMGEPGTGKTTTIKKIRDLAEQEFPEMKQVFLAPTGRASRRMEESIEQGAETIHHALKLGIQDDDYDKEEVKLENSLIVIDEMSMVDIRLMYKLLKAIKPGCIVILVGDINQLPSVGAGRVLQDIIESHIVPVTELKHIHRQDMDARIYINAHNINNGIHDIQDGSDFKFHTLPMSEQTEKEMVDRVVEQTDKYGLGNVMCLCPYIKGMCGVERMNAMIQQRLNPKHSNYEMEIITNGYTIRTGDLVMQIKRNTEEATNGEIGIVKDIDRVEDKPCVFVQFDKNCVKYKKGDFEYLTLAYASTVHKSQGSEAKAVISCLWDYHSNMKYRAIPYVAISRGKSMVDFYGSRSALDEAIDNIKQLQRISLFGRFLKYEAGEYVHV